MNAAGVWFSSFSYLELAIHANITIVIISPANRDFSVSPMHNTSVVVDEIYICGGHATTAIVNDIYTFGGACRNSSNNKLITMYVQPNR